MGTGLLSSLYCVIYYYNASHKPHLKVTAFIMAVYDCYAYVDCMVRYTMSVCVCSSGLLI